MRRSCFANCQKLPRTDEEYCSVTLDLDGGVKVRAARRNRRCP